MGWSVGKSGELFVCSYMGDAQENRVVCSGNLHGSQHTAEPGSPSAKLNPQQVSPSHIRISPVAVHNVISYCVASKAILLSKESGRQRCRVHLTTYLLSEASVEKSRLPSQPLESKDDEPRVLCLHSHQQQCAFNHMERHQEFCIDGNEM